MFWQVNLRISTDVAENINEFKDCKGPRNKPHEN